jgi:ADP-ribose pyrophosphatase
MSERQEIYSNGFLKVESRPAGGREMITVDRVRTQTGVILVPVSADGKVILVREYREGAQDWVVGVVKGAKDSNDEDYETVARRELLEELGMEAGKVVDTGIDVYALPSLTATQGRIMCAYGCKKVQAPSQEDDEFVEVFREVGIPELILMLRSGQINDCESLSALQSIILHNI